jgi:hypothetical protein
MYRQKVISKKTLVDVLKFTDEIAGSRSEPDPLVRGRYGSADPDLASFFLCFMHLVNNSLVLYFRSYCATVPYINDRCHSILPTLWLHLFSLVWALSAFTLGALYYFNYTDVGLINAIKMLWKL